MADNVFDIRTESELREIKRLISEGRKAHGRLFELNLAGLEVFEVRAFLSHEGSGEGLNLTLLLCDYIGEESCAVGIIRLTPEQWQAVRETGDQMIETAGETRQQGENGAASDD